VTAISNEQLMQLGQQLIEAGLQVAKLGLVPLTHGNLSIRDPQSGHILMTPHDYAYEQMAIEDLVATDLAGNVVGGKRKPSSETQVHLAVYERRPEVQAIVHVEPIYSNVFGVLHMPIAPVLQNALHDVGGEVPVMPYLPSGSREFGNEMLKVMEGRNAVVWANHGILAVGDTMDKAMHCTIVVEMAAQVYHMALQHGTPHVIPEELHDLIVG
jgi:ribulose-5-phosphate 4-epimerase/fuculose-1-phosphate aldolase